MYKIWGNEKFFSFNNLVEYLVTKQGYNKEDATACVKLAEKTGFSKFNQQTPVKKELKIFKLHC